MTTQLLANAIAAGGLAVSVYLLARFLNRSASVHLLWVVVLLRFIAPPLFVLSLDRFPTTVNSGPHTATATRSTDATASTQSNASSSAVESGRFVSVGLWRLAQVIWVAGSFVVIVQTAKRTLRLRRLIGRDGQSDAATTEQVQRIARETDVRETPVVFLVRARISPMVWAFCCRPILLLPKGLWSDLSPNEQEAILKHEMAHIQRRDHWVRVVEFVATVTHWWCPFLWWARRELHRHEERCCDSWATGASDSARAALAQACLRTVDYIGGPRPAEFGVTPMAGYHSIRERLQFILDDSIPEHPRRRGSWMAAAVAFVTLVISPGVADDRPSSETRQQAMGVILSNGAVISATQSPIQTRPIARQTPFARLKMRAFKKLTGVDLQEVVAEEVHDSLMMAVESSEVSDQKREELRQHLPRAFAEVRFLFQRYGHEEMTLGEFVTLVQSIQQEGTSRPIP